MKPLLHSADLVRRTVAAEQPPHRTVRGLVQEAGAASFLVGKRGVDLEALLPEIQKEQDYDIPSRGDWSLHEMIEYVLTKTGPAEVWLASWGITENPLRQVMRLCSDRVITRLHALFDSRVKLQCPNAYQLAMASNVHMRLAKNHSKLVVFLNETWGATIYTSANLTENPRLEYYMLSTRRKRALFNREWMDLELQDAQPFENE